MDLCLRDIALAIRPMCKLVDVRADARQHTQKLRIAVPVSYTHLVAAVKAQPVRTLAGSAADASASTGLDCGQPAEDIPPEGSKPL